MDQRDRDRLVIVRKVSKKLIKQSEAAEQLEVSVRQVRRLVRKWSKVGDKAVVHGLRGQPSNRKICQSKREKIVRILSQEVYQGFGPTLASEYLANKHKLKIGRETLRQIMIQSGLWTERKRKAAAKHQWRPRRSCRGELVQWDTSEHDWLEGRGEKLYLIHMIDDATSELTAQFVRHDSTESNLRVLWAYLQRNGRPLAFYTDKASIFQTAPKTARDAQASPRAELEPMPPTQIGRALQELGIVWIAAHSPQAKGRVERSFGTAQDRLVKGLRVAGARTLEQANQYLEVEFLPWWSQHLTAQPANPTDAHRSLGPAHDLNASLSHVESRVVDNDHTISIDGKPYQLAKGAIPTGLRGATVRLEKRLDGSMAVRFRDRYVTVEECAKPPKAKAVPKPIRPPKRQAPAKALRAAMNGLAARSSLPIWKAASIDRTRTRDVLD